MQLRIYGLGFSEFEKSLAESWEVCVPLSFNWLVFRVYALLLCIRSEFHVLLNRNRPYSRNSKRLAGYAHAHYTLNLG